jgi:hypothetical protein
MNFNDIRWDVLSDDFNCPHLLILVFDTDGRFTVLGYFKWFLAIEVSLLRFASSYFDDADLLQLQVFGSPSGLTIGLPGSPSGLTIGLPTSVFKSS